FVSETRLGQDKVRSSFMRRKFNGDLCVSRRARKGAALIPQPVEDELFGRTYFAKRSVQIVHLIMSAHPQAESASGVGRECWCLCPMRVFRRQKPLSHGLRVRP